MTADAREGRAGEGICGPSATLTRCYWQARYDQEQTGWDRGNASPTLLRWLAAGDLRPCRILVPGCGRGHEVVALAKAGFDVTGVDFVPAAVAAVQSRLASHRQTLATLPPLRQRSLRKSQGVPTASATTARSLGNKTLTRSTASTYALNAAKGRKSSPLSIGFVVFIQSIYKVNSC